MTANGDNKRQLTYTPIDERSPSISPDGKKIVYTTNAGDIWIVNVMTKQTKKLNLELKNVNHCRFSPESLIIKLLPYRKDYRIKAKSQTSSKRYKKLVARLRAYLKNEIERCFNKLIKLYRPARIIVEKLDLKSPHLSKRMNRLVQLSQTPQNSILTINSPL